jgi:cell division protein FtsB
MSDFLNFLNTADLDTLTKIPGITRVIAGNIIAARPFDSVEDCLKARGMGKNLLARAQSAFETGGNDSESRAMIQVEEDAMPALIEKSRPAQESVEEKPSFLSRLGLAFVNFLRALLRLIVTVLVIGGIGAGLYYGLPFLNEKLIVPIERNSAEIVQLKSEVDALQTQLDETNSRVDTLEKSIEAHSASLTKLDEIQTTLENKIRTTQDETLLKLKREVMLTRALDMLGRARLYLAQSNFGLAKEDVQSARDVLAELQFETQNELLGQVIARLDLALGNLPAFPVVAAGDLEIAWQLLMTGVPENTATAIITPEVLITETPTLMVIPSITSTPTEMPSATPTP